MLYGQALLMKQLLEKEGVPTEVVYQEGLVFAMGETLPDWAVMIAGGKAVGAKICREKQFYNFYNQVKANPKEFAGGVNMLLADDGGSL